MCKSGSRVGAAFLLDQQELAFYSAPTRAWQFASGALLALGWGRLLEIRSALPTVLSPLAAWIGLALVGWGALTLRGDSYPGLGALIPTAGTLLLLAAADVDRSPVGWLLRSRPVVFVGDLSYSLYLWHWPLLIVGNSLLGQPRGLTSVVIVGASIIPAYVSFRWIEEPIRKADWLVGRKAVALVISCMLVPAGLSALFWWSAKNFWWNPTLVAWELARVERPASRAAGCHANAGTQTSAVEDCTFGEGDRGAILVVGDSHAASLGDSVIAAAHGTGLRVSVHSTNGCPFLSDVTAWDIWRGSDATETCRRGVARSWELVDRLRPNLLIIVNASSMYVRESRVYADDSVAASEWGRAVSVTVETAKERGVPVLLVHEVPEHPKSLAACTRSWGTDSACVNSPTETILQRRSRSFDAETAALKQNPGVVGWDPAATLCNQEKCTRQHDGLPIYLDRNHLNPRAARLLEGPLREVIEASARR